MDSDTKVAIAIHPVKIKKKRGRKPKVKSETEIEPKIPKKRGRKPKDNYFVLNKNKLPPKPFKENIIVHLPINPNKLENLNETTIHNTTIGKNELDPKPYDPYNSINMKIPTTQCNICWWDDHEFNSNRWGIPTKIVKEKFHIYGSFCSPNCAAAYLFNMYKDTDDIWNKYSLLNFMYNSIYDTDISVKLSPSKLIIKKYGGTLTINEYRSNLNNKQYNNYINIPNTIINNITVEDINNNSNDTNDSEKDLRLYRRGPVIDFKKTLDNSMKLNIV
tara:strand:+ start:170 stop:994 length:825 start_codon:yes stop_codon:yes gene_type:complete